MKITPISSPKTAVNKTNNKKSTNRVLSFKNYSSIPVYDFSVQYVKPKINSIYENYDIAKKIFRKNIEDGKGIFGSTDNLEELMQNDTIRRNVVVFFAEYSKEKMDEIASKKIVSIDCVKEYEALKQVNDFFSDFVQLWPEDEINNRANVQIQKSLAFAGNMTKQQEKECSYIVHAFSAGCGLVSAAMGEGAAVGADTLILRPAQFLMFSIMANKLNVPAIPSLEYYLKEMCQGATLGVGGAKLITSWLGIAGHTASAVTGTSIATGGASNAAITGGVRAVNATLSMLITEKMGRGYIRRVKENRMTFKDQTIEMGGYFLARGIFAHETPFSQLNGIDFKDASSPELIKDALLKMPEGYQKTASGLIKILAKDALNTGELFVGNFALTLIASQEKDPKKIKEMASKIFRQCMIQTVCYEFANTAVKGSISKEATEAIKDMQENLAKYPEVYRVIINKEHEFFEQINIDTLKSDAFTNQFVNRTFVTNLSRFCKEAVREVEYAWVNRNGAKNQAELIKAIDEKRREQEKGKQIDSSLTPEEKAEYERAIQELQDILDRQKQIMTMRDNFGYGRIAGYENEKEILTQKFITPLSLQETSLQSKIPNAFLLYGPTGVGKSELVKAVAEQGKCRLVQFSDADSIEELNKFLEQQIKRAKNSDRHFVIQIDEFDEFGSDDELSDFFLNLLISALKII